MRYSFAMLILISGSASAMAQTLEVPAVQPGDSWVYRNTHEVRPNTWSRKDDELVVLRVSSAGILVTSKEVGAATVPVEQMVGRDWSRFRDVNGVETVVNQPYAFPLKADKTWRIEYTEHHPNRAHLKETFSLDYRAAGWEDVQVPAGTFHALKIEADGRWVADIAAAAGTSALIQGDQSVSAITVQTAKAAPRTATGRLYKAFWYAPEVKRGVKVVEEYFDASGVRNERYTGELVSFKLAAPP